MQTMIVQWLRHAESEGNAGLKTSSPETIALTSRGKEDATVFAAAMDQAPNMVVVSSFRRARETAMPILSRFQGAGQVTLPVHEFTYLCPERCRATSFDDRLAVNDEDVVSPLQCLVHDELLLARAPRALYNNESVSSLEKPSLNRVDDVLAVCPEGIETCFFALPSRKRENI